MHGLSRLLPDFFNTLMIWPFSGKQCSAAFECFRGNKADAQVELTLLPTTSPSGATMKDMMLVKDGCATSRIPMDEDESRSMESMPPIFAAIQNGDVEEVKDELKDDPETTLNTKYGGVLPLHMACHARRLDMLAFLLKAGAKVDAMEGLGQTALHLAVFYAWHDGVETLLKHGASPNTLCEPPPGVKGLRIETPMHLAVRRGDLPSTVLLLQHRPDLAQRDSDLCSVLHLAASSRSLEIMRQILKEKQVREVIKSKESKGNSVLHMALMNECDAVCEATIHDLVKELVQVGADINDVNLQGESPLFFAAQHRLSRVVETLIDFGADVTVVTRNGQSLLHAACLRGCATSLGHILKTGQVQDLVISCDNDGYAPFHYAVQSGSIDCCELLLTNGDHLTRLNKDGLTRCSVILRQLPSATQLLKRLFDNHVRLSNVPHHDPNFRVTFDYSVITLEGVQSSLISELSSSRVEALLKHPLLESFLFLKWNRIKPFFYCTVFFYLLFLLLHTTFIVMTFGKKSWVWQGNPNSYTIFLVLHITMFLLIMFPDLVIMFANLKKYLYQWETYTKIIALTSSAFVVFSCFPFFKHIDSLPSQERSMNNSWKNSSEPPTDDMMETMVTQEMVRYAAAISAFFSWVEFMMLLGRFPSLGSYVLMFTRVARAIIKFLAAFSSLIIGFSVSFLVLFSKKDEFGTLPLSFTKTLMMMIGEIEFSNLIHDLDFLSGVFLVVFLFLVCILMTNLLIGLAVNDLPDLQRQGKIRRLSKQVSYLVSYERLMVVARSLFCFPHQLRILLSHRCKIPQSVDVFPNKSNGYGVSRKSSHYPIPTETLQEAIILGNEDSKIDFNSMEEEDTLPMQFRSFKIKYDRDRRQLQRRLAQLPDTITTETMLKERLDRMEQMIQYQIINLSLQLQKHHFVCSNCQQLLPDIRTQTGQWQTVIPRNFQVINATQSCPVQPSANNWCPAQAVEPLSATRDVPQVIPGNMRLQTSLQQHSSIYKEQT